MESGLAPATVSESPQGIEDGPDQPSVENSALQTRGPGFGPVNYNESFTQENSLAIRNTGQGSVHAVTRIDPWIFQFFGNKLLMDLLTVC